MNDNIDPSDPRYALTCDGMPTVEEAEESKRLLRESNPLWLWGDDYCESEQLMRQAGEWAKQNMIRTEPARARLLWPDLFK